jgi:hypothetical protein
MCHESPARYDEEQGVHESIYVVPFEDPCQDLGRECSDLTVEAKRERDSYNVETCKFSSSIQEATVLWIGVRVDCNNQTYVGSTQGSYKSGQIIGKCCQNSQQKKGVQIRDIFLSKHRDLWVR